MVLEMVQNNFAQEDGLLGTPLKKCGHTNLHILFSFRGFHFHRWYK